MSPGKQGGTISPGEQGVAVNPGDQGGAGSPGGPMLRVTQDRHGRLDLAMEECVS
jgi:hypothetical protein